MSPDAYTYLDFIYLRVHQGLGPGIPCRAAVSGGSGLLRKRSPSPFGRFGLQGCGGRPLPPSPSRGFIFLLLFILFGGRTGIRAFGYCVRSAATTKATPGLFGLLLGRLLRHLVGRRDQHLCQKWDGRVFGQKGRTLDPLRLLRPALGELNKHALSSSFGSCGYKSLINSPNLQSGTVGTRGVRRSPAMIRQT